MVSVGELMDPLAFSLAVLALLATPGPTNTLLASSGASVGFSRSLKLIPSEVCGYLVSISALIALFAPLIVRYPQAVIGLKVLASLWLAFYALRLWREAGVEIGTPIVPISIWRVFVTTLLNPKALIFALGIFPHGSLVQEGPWFAGFCALVIIVATGWIVMGTVVARSAGALVTPQRIGKAAAICLALFATVIVGSAIAAVH